MAWKVRHQSSPQARTTTLSRIADGLRDGIWEPTDEVQGPGETTWTAIENHPHLAEIADELEPIPPSREDETRLDMTALIDVCLVLLIFFMMTTTYAVAVQKAVPLPTVSPEQTRKKAHSIERDQVLKYMVRVDAVLDAKGRPVIQVQGFKVDVLGDDATIDTDKLSAELIKYTRGNPPRIEMLLDAKNVSWGLVVSIQDAARWAGVRTVYYPAQEK